MHYKINKHTEDTKQKFWKPTLAYEELSHNIDVLYLGLNKEGTHKIRIIPTLDNELIAVKYYHDYKVDGKLKSVVCPGKGCPICKVADEVNDSFLKPNRFNKSFIYLIDTDSPDKNWIPGNYYILHSYVFYSRKDRFEEALTSYINKTLETGINGKILLDNLFDYTKETQGCLQVRVQSREVYSIRYSTVDISFIDISFDPSTKSPKLDEDIFKDFGYFEAINFIKKLNLKELEEDAKKLRLKYNNQKQQ